MKYTLILSLYIAYSSAVFAQRGPNPQFASKNIELTALIIDSLTGEKVEFASARVYSSKDSSVVGGALTDSSGRFTLPNLSVGNYYLKVSFIGYTTKQINNLLLNDEKKIWDLGRISLKTSGTQDLAEVKVVGQLDVLKAGIDKKVYNVGEDLNNQGGSANDVLNNVPSIDVNQDGKISLRGDGNVIILIDGRPSSLSGNSGKSLLDALPANSIERIEVVTNPSAKYDPDGTSGIINIVLKKNKLRGFNGSVTGTAATGNLYNGAASLSYRNNKFNVYGNYANNYSEGTRDFYGDLDQTFGNGSETHLNQFRDGVRTSKSQNFRAGIDYGLTDRQTIGVSGNYGISQDDPYSNLMNRLTDEDGNMIRSWDRISLDPSKNNNIDVNGFYKLEFKEGKGEITADANHSIGKENRAGYYSEKYYIENGSTANKNVLQQRLKNKEDNIITTLQTDYVRIVTPLRARIEAGAKVIMRDQLVNTYSEAYNYGIDEWSADTLANFDYAYQERIYSTYGIFGQQQGKWKYQAGVRVEYAQQIPNLLSTNTKITNDYFNLFPSAHLKYAVTDKKELGISYSRRVNRASAGQMNPFTNYSDPNNLRTGNPYLIPEYINSLDLGFAVEGKKLNFTSSVFYRYTTDVIQRVKLFYPNSISAVTYANIDESQSYGLELILSYKPTKWFKNTLSMNADRIEYIDRSGETNFNNSGYNFSAKYSGSADFWKKTASIQVNGRFNAPRITAQGKILPRAAVDLSAEKRFKDNKWSIGMRLSDVFNTQGFQFEFDQDFIHQRGEYKWLTRRFYVTVSYKFGKLEVSKKGNRQGEGGGGFDF